MAQLLRGTAFITGAAKGIGQQIALSFAKYGITSLALADIDFSSLQHTHKLLSTQFHSIGILPLRMDVRDSKLINDAMAEMLIRLEAGISGLTHELDEEDIMRVLDVNLHGVYRCQRAELAVMVRQEDKGPREGRGRIINMASMYGLIAPNHQIPHTAYTTAKHGVVGLTRGDANAYAAHNTRINALCPGYVNTPLVRTTMDLGEGSPLQRDVERTPLGRLATVEEIAESAVCLASGMMSFANGGAVVVDGGFTSN